MASKSRRKSGSTDRCVSDTGKDKKIRIVTVESSTTRRLEDVLRIAQVDLAVWEVERHIINKWDNVAKLKRKDSDQLAASELWQVKVWLRRKVSRTIEQTAELFLKRMVGAAPKFPHVTYHAPKKPHMLELSLFDVHFGKRAWARETGVDYDLPLAENVYDTAVETLLHRTSPYPVEKILFPVGQDFLHIDNAEGTTANGTRQDVDTRLAKIFTVAAQAVIKAVNRCAAVAPVELLWVPGNHDRMTSWWLCQFLWAYYHKNKNVTVDAEPTSRKYRSYGCNLIGFTHGDEERITELPSLMAAENPDVFGKATHREFHLGHWHKRKILHAVGGDSIHNVTTRILPSLSGTDAWHYRKGYVRGARAAEAYLWSKREGYVGHFST